MKDSVILIGSGGHGKVVVDLIKKSGDRIIGCLDDDANCAANGYPYLGRLVDFVSYVDRAHFILAIGDNHIRENITRHMERQAQIRWKTYLHPAAQISKSAKIGAGCVVMANAVLNAAAEVGKHCIINTGAIVEHDARIADYAHIAPRAVLGGGVVIGARTQIGIGAVVKDHVRIAADCLIGAGAVVVKNIAASGVYIGVPAKKTVRKDV